jgi:hypothetical protein
MPNINHRDFWDTKHLKSELAANAISEGKLFLYFFAITGFDWLQFTAIRLSSTPDTIYDWERVDALSTLFLTVIGLIFLFLCNGGIRGKDFLYRYFPLSFVIGWKFMVCASITIWLVDLVMFGEPAYFVGLASTATFSIFNIAMFLRIGFHIREVACGNFE